MIARRSPQDLVGLRAAGRVVAEMHDAIRAAVRPGVTTAQLDRVARDVLARRGAQSNFLGYHGFPAVICASVNDVVIHGIPDGRRLDEGDIVGIDCGAIVDGWHGDAAFTVGVGTIAPSAQRLIDVTERSLLAAIDQMRDGHRLSDIGHAVQSVAEAAGLGVVRDYCGHGIGRAMHEEPDVKNYGRSGRGPRLVPGIVLAIEPMLTLGGHDVDEGDDGWAVFTADGSLAAHVEHTVLVTDADPEILTRW